MLHPKCRCAFTPARRQMCSSAGAPAETAPRHPHAAQWLSGRQGSCHTAQRGCSAEEPCTHTCRRSLKTVKQHALQNVNQLCWTDCTPWMDHARLRKQHLKAVPLCSCLFSPIQTGRQCTSSTNAGCLACYFSWWSLWYILGCMLANLYTKQTS